MVEFAFTTILTVQFRDIAVKMHTQHHYRLHSNPLVPLPSRCPDKWAHTGLSSSVCLFHFTTLYLVVSVALD